MKALAYEQAHSVDKFAIELREVPDPALRNTDLLIEVRAVSINPGEAFIRGMRSAPPGGRVILGWEFSGIVVRAGAATTGFAAGDRVFGTGDISRDGCWAELVAVDFRVVGHAPQSHSFTDVASLPIGTLTAWESLFRDEDQLPERTDTVLVIGGAGGVGSMAIQLLKEKTYAQVIATASRVDSQLWCTKMGADLVIDHSADVAAQLSAVGIADVDFVMSTHATEQNLNWLVNVIRPYGHLAAIDIGRPFDVSPITARSLTFHSEMVFTKVLSNYEVESISRILQTTAALVEAEKLRPITGTVLHGLKSETMKKAHELVGDGKAIGKIVIEY